MRAAAGILVGVASAALLLFLATIATREERAIKQRVRRRFDALLAERDARDLRIGHANGEPT